MIDRFEESGVASSAAFGIWNANTVFSPVDLSANTGQWAGTENCTRPTIVKSTKSVGGAALASKHAAKMETANALCDLIARIVRYRYCTGALTFLLGQHRERQPQILRSAQDDISVRSGLRLHDRFAGDQEPHAINAGAGADVERLAIGAAPGHVGHALGDEQSGEVLAFGRENHYAPGACAIDVSLDIDFHAVGPAGARVTGSVIEQRGIGRAHVLT